MEKEEVSDPGTYDNYDFIKLSTLFDNCNNLLQEIEIETI